MPRAINLLVVHCSASPNERTLFEGVSGTPGFRNPAQVIDAWHVERGFRRGTYWRGRQEPSLVGIGYHFVIARNGAVFGCRHIEEVGAHAKGWNEHSLGICLVGTDQFTDVQLSAARKNIELLAKRHDIPLAPPVFGQRPGWAAKGGVCGHRDLPGVAKACPGFDVDKWVEGWK